MSKLTKITFSATVVIGALCGVLGSIIYLGIRAPSTSATSTDMRHLETQLTSTFDHQLSALRSTLLTSQLSNTRAIDIANNKIYLANRSLGRLNSALSAIETSYNNLASAVNQLESTTGTTGSTGPLGNCTYNPVVPDWVCAPS